MFKRLLLISGCTIHMWCAATNQAQAQRVPVPSASVIKVPILVELFHQVEKGTFKLTGQTRK